MSLTRVAIGFGVVTCVAVLVAAACGGRVRDPNVPVGYLDDAGVFHLADGGILFGPGTACVGFDAAVWAKIDPSLAWGPQFSNIVCDADSDCAFILPPGWPYQSAVCLEVLPVGNSVRACAVGAGLRPVIIRPACQPGSEAEQHLPDPYCSAFYQQFVVDPGATAISRCIGCGQNSVGLGYCPPGQTGKCWTDCRGPNGAGEALWVRRGNAPPFCMNPCQPP